MFDELDTYADSFGSGCVGSNRLSVAARGHTGLWVPRHLLLHPDLSASEKILVAEIRALQGGPCGHGCYMSNANLGQRIGVGERQVRDYIRRLIDAQHLIAKNRTSTQRRLWVAEALYAGEPPEDAGDGSSLDERGSIPSPRKHDPRQIPSVQPGTGCAGPARTSLPTRQDGSTKSTYKQPERTPKNTVSSIAVERPEWWPTSLWEDWFDHSRALRRELTPGALRLQIKQLLEFDARGSAPVKVIERAIAGGFKAFVELPERERPRIHTCVDGRRISGREMTEQERRMAATSAPGMR